MKLRKLSAAFCIILLLLTLTPVWAQKTSEPLPTVAETKDKEQAKSDCSAEQLAVTHHTIEIGGKTIHYTVTAGLMPLKDKSGKEHAQIFFIAYVEDSKENKKRPVTFAFNGGPGASSVWLNLGGIGPKRVPTADIKPSPPPYELESNQESWISFTDLVFIDPVGTGFSRAASGVKAKDFYGIEADVHSIGCFIQQYTTRYERWLSPKFIAGESYGTLRAVELADYLHSNYGMDINGIVLLSSALDFQTFSFQLGNDLPYVLFLPSYAATAFYHKKLAPELQQDLNDTTREVEEWAVTEYIQALGKGSSLNDQERLRFAAKLAKYTGLSEEFVQRNNLRITRSEFMTELLKEQHLTVGLMDGRAAGEGSPGDFFNDPSMLVTIGPYVAAINDYLSDELGYKSTVNYIYLSEEANDHWNYGSALHGYVNVMDSLKKAISARDLKVFVASGYFDLDTPYLSAKYTMAHLELPKSLQNNITFKCYDSGHMLYISDSALKQLTSDVSDFVAKSVPENAK